MKSYLVPAKWTYRGEAVVEAENPEEAVEKFCHFKDTELQESAAELIDWELDGEPKEQL